MDLRHSQNSRWRPGSMLSRCQLTTLALSFIYRPPSGIAVPRHSMHFLLLLLHRGVRFYMNSL
jgi:hypothetical protein